MAKATVSIILPVYNAAQWLDECLDSICRQEVDALLIQLSVYNDGSTDNSLEIIKKWHIHLMERDINVIIGGHIGQPKGVGYAKNQAVRQSTGEYLCFQDSDDVMKPQRIQCQYEESSKNPTAIVGCKFKRDPPDSTARYTNWANNLTENQLEMQVYTSHGPTVIMPTWFCARCVFDKVGGFDETGKGTPEDLIFFYRHLELGGKVRRVDETLLVYRYHPQQTTFSVDEKTIWDIRMRYFEKNVLERWTFCTIWNAGKQGRRFYRSLQPKYRERVIAFCDVDTKKIQQKFYEFQDAPKPKPRIPIVHFAEANGPFVICMKLDLTNGQFEENLKSLYLEEGQGYVLFS